MAKTFKLTAQEKADSGFTHVFHLTHEDLTETSVNTAQTFVIDNTLAGDILLGAAHFTVTDLEDASDAAFNSSSILIGDNSLPNRYLTSTQVNANGSSIKASVTSNTYATSNFAATSDGQVELTVNSMAAKALNNIDTGELWLFWTKVSLPPLTK